MSSPTETEIKLVASPSMLDALVDHPALVGEEVRHRLHNTWFDTPVGDLHRAGAMLRVRDTGHGREQTLKLASRGSLARMEWTAPVPGTSPDPALFPSKAQRRIRRLIKDRPLEEIASAEVERRERTIRWRGATVAVAFDRGSITAGPDRAALCELEIELIGGPLVDALSLAGELPLGPELYWSGRSKAARAMALARGEARGSAAQPLRLQHHMPATAGFQRIAWNVLGQLLSAYPLVLKDGSPEGVHQSRVALRRLRSAIRLFGPLVRDEQMPVLRAALGTAARGLGKARDLFVLAETIAAVPSAAGPDSTEVSDHLVASLAAATADAQAVLASAPFQRLLFELATWVEAGNWLDQAAPTDLRTFAAHAIGRARRRLLRRGLDLAALDEEARHEVRKDAKQLRYAVGFLETLWPQPALRKDKARFARELARLQDSLGMLNDLAVAADHESLFTDLDPITAARLGARVETLVGTRSDSRRKLLRKAEKALARIAETHPWWKHR